MTPIEEPKLGPMTMMFIAILGGAARQAHQWLSGYNPTWRHFIVRAIVSSFVGIVCYFALPRDAAWSYAATGLFSWMGADGIALLSQIVIKKDVGKDPDTKK